MVHTKVDINMCMLRRIFGRAELLLIVIDSSLAFYEYETRKADLDDIKGSEIYSSQPEHFSDWLQFSLEKTSKNYKN